MAHPFARLRKGGSLPAEESFAYLQAFRAAAAVSDGCQLGATRSASCLLADHLFLHLLLHFLGRGFCNVGSDHPSVTLGIDNDPTAVPPKHIHHRSLGRGAELYG